MQETLIAVAGAISQYQRRDHAGAFRGWLAAIARNKLADYLAKRSRQEVGSGDTNVQNWLSERAAEDSTESVWDWQQKQQVFLWAAQKVRGQVSEPTWQAFYRTCVLNDSVAEVSSALNMRVGMVYVARSRVMARLREAAQVWTHREDPE